MYADDTLLYTYGKDVDKIKHALNNDLKQLENWLSLNQMLVNISKTKVMLLHSKTKQRILHDFDVYLNDEGLEIVDQYKYLGVIIDSNLRWQEHVDNLCKRISMKLAVLRTINPCSPEGFSQTHFPKGDCCNPPWIINTEGHITLNLLPVYSYGHPLSIDTKISTNH